MFIKLRFFKCVKSRAGVFAAGQTQFFSSILILLGIISLGVAYVFILGQEDYKRMFAYSSVEHMGILAIGIGLGGAGIYGSLLHMINNAFTKGFAFLVTGNLYQQYHSKKASEVKGVLRALSDHRYFSFSRFFGCQRSAALRDIYQ